VQGLFTIKPRVDARHNFAYGGLMVCGICGCKLTPGIYKKKFTLYHCTFSRGKHDNAPYLNEARLTAMFDKTINKIALTDYEFDRLKIALKDGGDGSAEAVENRLQTLTVERKALEARISRLYDEKLDKKVSEEFWSAKNTEYSAIHSGIEKQIDELKRDSVYYYDEGLSVLEPLKELKSLYENEDSFGKAELLKIVSLNHKLIQENLKPDYKKPYIFIAELRERSEWGK
jgi:site-specific DNA recombinase